MKEFLYNILSGADGESLSSKRLGGFISLFACIAFGAFGLTEAMIIMAGLVTAFFGLASLDYKAFLKTNPTTVEQKTVPVNP